LNRGIERIPNQTAFWADLGMAHAVLAAYDLEHGRDPQPSLEQASKAIRTAQEETPNDVQSQLYLGETRGIAARFRARQGRGNAGDFAEAAQALQKAIDLEPDNQDARIALGHFCRAWAAFQRDTGDDTGSLASLTRGLALANQVLTQRSAWPYALVLRASLLLAQAQSSPSAAERRTLAASAGQDFTRALALHPALRKVWGSQAALAQQIAAASR
jgi:serine/threonine-protein kinase